MDCPWRLASAPVNRQLEKQIKKEIEQKVKSRSVTYQGGGYASHPIAGYYGPNAYQVPEHYKRHIPHPRSF